LERAIGKASGISPTQIVAGRQKPSSCLTLIAGMTHLARCETLTAALRSKAPWAFVDCAKARSQADIYGPRIHSGDGSAAEEHFPSK
jgi:hypothetical protein